MKLTDYVIRFLADKGIDKIFLVTGGAAAHIVDSIGQLRDQGVNVNYVCMQHEQAAAMAAESYARLRGVPGATVATSGPGAINLISGICCAWFDSIPIINLTGQVNIDETKGESGVRQLGFQETEVAGMMSSITKFSHQLQDPQRVRYVLEEAFYRATSGRPGPVLIDIPLNVQHADIDPDTLIGFTPPAELTIPASTLEAHVKEVYQLLASAERPLIIAGSGIKIARSVHEFRALLEKLNIPMVPSWSGIDIMGHDHPLFVGQYGVYGNRGANFAVQNADLIIAIGSRLDTRQTGRDGNTFARGAKKVIVDIDEKELRKGEVVEHRVRADLAIHADAGAFVRTMLEQKGLDMPKDRSPWISRCQEWKQKYPAVLPEWYEQEGSVNAYAFIETLSEELQSDDIIIPDQGGNLTWTMQAFKIKTGQQLYSAYAHSPMGYALPSAIGAAFATGKQKNIIMIDGDGGFQMNIQELQTIVHHNLPIKMIILNNRGYGIIKQFQEIYFDARYEATGRGYSWPNFIDVGKAYGIEGISIDNHEEMRSKIQTALHWSGPMIIDVRLDEAQKLIPKLVADKLPDGRYISKPLEDMAPFLPREEFLANMIVPPLQEEAKEKSDEIN